MMHTLCKYEDETELVISDIITRIKYRYINRSI